MIPDTTTTYDTLRAHGVPPNLHDGLVRYVHQHIPTGAFLRAVLENDLAMAARRADPITAHFLTRVVEWLDACAPPRCWGSPARVDAWIAERKKISRDER